MRQSGLFFILAIAGAGLSGYLASKVTAPGPATPPASSVGSQKEVLILGNAPQFTLTDSQGASFNSEALAGKVWVLNFFFTSCDGPCPKMNGELVRLANDYNGKVEFLSITSDPETDTAPVLAAYKKKMGGDALSWTLLTGAQDEVVRIAKKGFGFAAGEPSLHTTRFILVDKTGKVRGYYSSDRPEELTTLRATLDSLL